MEITRQMVEEKGIEAIEAVAKATNLTICQNHNNTEDLCFLYHKPIKNATEARNVALHIDRENRAINMKIRNDAISNNEKLEELSLTIFSQKSIPETPTVLGINLREETLKAIFREADLKIVSVEDTTFIRLVSQEKMSKTVSSDDGSNIATLRWETDYDCLLVSISDSKILYLI